MSKLDRWREKCYADVPEALYADLRRFRAQYPYRKMRIDGYEWRYILAGDGPENLLILPGSTTSGESNWREIPRFLPKFRVLSLGYPPVKSVEALFEGILRILDAEDMKRVDVYGASMGAAIAHWLIRSHPERVNRLILLSLGMPNQDTAAGLKKAVATFSLIPAFVIRGMFRKEGRRLVSALPEDEARLMAAYFRDQYQNDMDKATILGHFRLVAEIAEKLEPLGLTKPFTGPNPVLIITAADDESFSKEARDSLAATYPNATTHEFPSGGHTLFGRREELNRLIDGFFGD